MTVAEPTLYPDKMKIDDLVTLSQIASGNDRAGSRCSRRRLLGMKAIREVELRERITYRLTDRGRKHLAEVME